ncbi:MAG: ABC transporter permease [Desulfovibrionaceae bacterium]|nr:ABC transporter permease [Desulfovibrionaceae bacterium]
MTRFILTRLLGSLPVLLCVTALLFALLQVAPGDPATLMMKEHADPEVVMRLRAGMHLADPLWKRYPRFVWAALHGDLGQSYKLGRPVAGMILEALPNTVALALCALLVSWLLGAAAGTLAALKPGAFIDRLVMGLSLTAVSTPVFWSALLLQWFFAVKLGLLPVSGFFGFKYLILPSLTLGLASAGTVARLARASLREAMDADYIRTARAKGLTELAVLTRHALKNALPPVLTVMALQAASLLSGAVITETVFAVPGVGRLSVEAIMARDMPLLQGAALTAAVMVILGNLAADVLVAIADPRVRKDWGKLL